MSSKTFNYEVDGLSYTVVLTETATGVSAEITVNSGFMDVNGLYWGDDDFSGDSVNLGEPLNMNGGGERLDGKLVQWDDAKKFSDPGLGREGTDKATYLAEGETRTFELEGVSLDDIVIFGVRATSTSTKEGSIKSVLCLAAGTLVATFEGLKPVEEIRIGDKVLTRDDGFQEVLWSGSRVVDATELARNPDFVSVMIRAGALGSNLPRRDLRVSPGHRMLVSGVHAELMFGERDVLIAASDLVGQPGISFDARPVTYVHIMFDTHQIIDSEGAWSESFQPADVTLNGLDTVQRDELLALFPELASRKGQRGYTAARRVLAQHESRALLGL